MINSKSYQLSDLDQKLGDWNVSKVPTNQVYKSSSWSLKKTFKTDYHVKTIEQVYSINKEYETCYLLQNPSNEEADETANPAADMIQEPSSETFLQTISRINFQKWHSKVRIIINKDFEIEVVALIDSRADLNCIQEGIIPSKYFRKTKERLTSSQAKNPGPLVPFSSSPAKALPVSPSVVANRWTETSQ